MNKEELLRQDENKNKYRCFCCGKNTTEQGINRNIGRYLAEQASIDAFGYITDYVQPYIVCDECAKELLEERKS